MGIYQKQKAETQNVRSLILGYSASYDPLGFQKIVTMKLKLFLEARISYKWIFCDEQIGLLDRCHQSLGAGSHRKVLCSAPSCAREDPRAYGMQL